MKSSEVDPAKGLMPLGNKLIREQERNWETTHVFRNECGCIYFGDTSTPKTPYLLSVENPIKEFWINYKFVLPNYLGKKLYKPRIRYKANSVHWEKCGRGIDIIHEPKEGGTKETIIIKDKDSQTEILYSVRIPKTLKVCKEEDGSINIVKKDLSSVFYLPKPTAWDSKNKPIDFRYKVKSHKNKKYNIFDLTITSNQKLTDYSFPITIDPITHIVVDSSSNWAISGDPQDEKSCEEEVITTKRDSILIFAKDIVTHDLYKWESFDDGVTWGKVPLNFGVSSFTYAVGIDSTDKLYIAHHQGTALVVRNSSDGFTSTDTLDSVSNFSKVCAVCEQDGTCHVVWSDWDGGTSIGDLYHASSDSWSTTRVIQSDNGNQYSQKEPSIAITPDQTSLVYCVWAGMMSGKTGFQIRNRNYSIAADSWGPVRTVTGLDDYQQQSPSIAVADTDIAYVYASTKNNTYPNCFNIYQYNTADSGATEPWGTGQITSYNTASWDQIGPQTCIKWAAGSPLYVPVWYGKTPEHTGVYNIKYGATPVNVTNTATPPPTVSILRNYTATATEPCFAMCSYNDDLIFVKPTGFDILNPGTVATDSYSCDPFDTKDPTVSVAMALNNADTNSGSTSVGMSITWTETHPYYTIFGISTDNSNWDTDAFAHPSGDPATDTTTVTLSEAFDGQDRIYYKATGYDCFDNIGTSTANIYATPATPTAPTVASETYGGFDLTVTDNNADSNSACQYSIVVDTVYVQADGTVDVSAVWQTKATWGDKTVVGLSSNQNYTCYSQSRNPNSTARVSPTGATVVAKTTSYKPVIGTIAETLPSDGSNQYNFVFDLSDSDNDTGTLTFRLYNGTTYTNLNNFSQDVTDTDLPDTPTSTAITWLAGSDLNDSVITTANMEIVCTDESSETISRFSDTFILDTKVPDFSHVSGLSTANMQSNSVAISWDSAVVEDYFLEYALYVSDQNLADAIAKGGLGSPPPYWDSDDDATLKTKATKTTTVTGLTQSKEYFVALYAEDSYGLYSTTTITTSFTTPQRRNFTGYILDEHDQGVVDARVFAYDEVDGALKASTTSTTRGYYTMASKGGTSFTVVAHKIDYASALIDDRTGYVDGATNYEDHDIKIDGDWTKLAAYETDIYLGDWETGQQPYTKAYTMTTLTKSYSQSALAAAYTETTLSKSYIMPSINKSYQIVS